MRGNISGIIGTELYYVSTHSVTKCTIRTNINVDCVTQYRIHHILLHAPNYHVCMSLNDLSYDRYPITAECIHESCPPSCQVILVVRVKRDNYKLYYSTER